MNALIKHLGLSLGLSLCLLAQPQVPDKKLEASPGQTLDVKLETGGSIHIRGGAEHAVTVKTKLTGRDADQIRVSVERSSGGVSIVSKYETNRSRQSGSADLEITVPGRFDLDLKSAGGDLRIEGVEGNLRGKTMGGGLDLSHLKGKVALSSMGGSISLVSSQVEGKVSTMGGTVTIKDVVGDIKGSSMGGNVVYDNVQRPGKTADEKEVVISTMGGEIRVPAAPSGANVKTMGGSIHIGSAKTFVKATTMGGSIDIKELDGGAIATTMGGDISVTMVGDPAVGNRDVRLESKGGEIHLTLPAGLSMTVDVEIEHTKNSTRTFKIDSEFPLAISETPEWSESRGTARKTLKGTASIGGGKHKIVIRTINGNVVIKKGR
ncbi:hypothetical protein [Geothrix sp. PMB-07]|uniref:hypothetical protein n=1 Tax=Geothrix sp. PMB-07 TaxID=3068640 RepID=UPI0027413596|nr:hypothetical protein [Geothrix sp. PMB-07]WLT31243.1 hypothetical protein Q9293_16120 [Geothrix sp. PMB-07]